MDGQTFFQTLLQSKSFNAPIQFNGGDETNSFPVKGSEVKIVESAGDHEVGSSKLHIKNIVNYGWEHKYYPGQLVCEHMCGVYLAYAIVTSGNVGVVRVLNRKTDERILIKGMTGPVADLAFAHIKKEVVVGCVDDAGNLFVYRIQENSAGLATERVLEVLRDKPVVGEHRLIWCPYLGGEDDDTDEEEDSCAHLLVLTHWDQCEMWLIDSVVEEHGEGPLRPQDVTRGLQKISEPGGIISDAAFSPDGTALATASLDGQVKFFQVYMKGEEEPRCLHQWSPHQGRPVTSLFFLDDHANYQPDQQFWKYAVTGCDFNSELKIWTCESWSCLQTIRFQAAPDDSLPLRLKAAMDSSARYLILSDIDRNLVYVLSLDVSTEVNTVSASVASVSEFTTPSSFLSICCSSAARRQVCMGEDGMAVLEDSDASVSRDSKEKTVVKLYLVQPKSLQECSIIFDDAAKAAALVPAQKIMQTHQLPSLSSLSALHLAGGDIMMSTHILAKSSPTTPDKRNTSSDELAEAASKIGLLSPQQFEPITPSLPPPDLVLKEEDVSEAEEDHEDEGEVDEEEEEEFDEEETYPPQLETVRAPEQQVLVSGNSSPSREVATILSTEDDLRYGVESGEEEAEITVQGTPSPDFHSTKIALNTSGTIFPQPPSVPAPPLLPKLVPAAPPTPAHHQQQQTLENLVTELQKQVMMLKQQETFSAHRLEQAVVGRVEAILSSRLENLLTSRLEAALASRLDSALTHSINHSMSRIEQQMEKQLKGAMEKLSAQSEALIHREFQVSIPNAVGRAMDPIRSKLEMQMNSKIAASDKIMMDSIAKMVSSPDFHSSVSKSVTRSLQPVIVDSYKTVFQTQLGGLERSMQQMLHAFHQQFMQGTKEYEQALRGRLEASELSQRDELSPIIRDLVKRMASLSATQSKISSQMEELGGRLEQDLTEVVRRELKTAASVSTVASSSCFSSLEVNQQDLKQTIQSMVSGGRLNDAFQTALSANDLPLVIFTCQLVNTTQIFSNSVCPLSQSVLLSLIQQLSVNLQEDTEVKHAFLEEALVNLDPCDSVTKKHVGNVLSILLQSVQNYTQANPHSKLSRNFKTLMMAATGIMAQNN